MIKHCLRMLLFLLLLSMKSLSQTGLLMSVSGKVLNVHSNQPVKNLTVNLLRIENRQVIDLKNAQTDDQGYYKIKYLEAGNYEYVLDIPKAGNVYIFSEGDSLAYDPYAFELKMGKNLVINFFIGYDQVPKIQKEIIDSNTIHFTLVYQEMPPLVLTNEKRENLRTDNNCKLLFNDPVVSTIDDTVNLGVARNGQEAGGLYTPYLAMNYHLICKDGHCSFDSIIVTLGASIQIHSTDWFKNHAGPNNSPDTIGSCLRGCLYQHELTHSDDAKKYIGDHYCQELTPLNEVSVNCDCPTSPDYYTKKCKKEIDEKFKNLGDRLKYYMLTTSEDNAYSVSDPLCKSCCRNNSN